MRHTRRGTRDTPPETAEMPSRKRFATDAIASAKRLSPGSEYELSGGAKREASRCGAGASGAGDSGARAGVEKIESARPLRRLRRKVVLDGAGRRAVRLRRLSVRAEIESAGFRGRGRRRSFSGSVAAVFVKLGEFRDERAGVETHAFRKEPDEPATVYCGGYTVEVLVFHVLHYLHEHVGFFRHLRMRKPFRLTRFSESFTELHGMSYVCTRGIIPQTPDCRQTANPEFAIRACFSPKKM